MSIKARQTMDLIDSLVQKKIHKRAKKSSKYKRNKLND